MISRLLLIALLMATQADAPADTGEKREPSQKVVIKTVPADSFEKVVHLLEKDKLVQADQLLDKRIGFLKKAKENDWQVRDGEPPLLQSLLLSSRLKIALSDYDGVMDNFEYLSENFKLSHPAILARTLASQSVRAKKDPELFKDKLVKMARVTWFFRVFQQNPEE